MSKEKKLLTELLQLYKDFPCLWDNREVLYSNKEARDQAYEVMLEKYKTIQEDATILDIKKKIEYMRCGYRREHKKVLLSRMTGDDPEYTPSLWYYDKLLFLNEVSDFSNIETVPRDNNQESIKMEYIEPKAKVRKRNLSAIYIPEQQGSDDDNDIENVIGNDTLPHLDESLNDNHASLHSSHLLPSVTESEAFGTTVGLQLKELEPMQRVIAEKLISDVIYHARLNKLSTCSSVMS